MDWNLANRSWYSHWEYFIVVRSSQNWFSTIESHIWPLDTFMKTQVKCEPLERQKSNWALDSLGNNHKKNRQFFINILHLCAHILQHWEISEKLTSNRYLQLLRFFWWHFLLLIISDWFHIDYHQFESMGVVL